MSTDLNARRQADTHWRAALLLDYVSLRIGRHGWLAEHAGPMNTCGQKQQEPVCLSHGLVRLNTRLTPHATGAAALMTGTELRSAYWLATDRLNRAARTATAQGNARQILLACASSLRAEYRPNPRYPQIRAQFVSMLTNELDSYTCWRCARTSYHPTNVAAAYCGACHLPERTDT